MLEEKLNHDLKTALLSGDKLTVDTLRSIKNAILYVKVAGGTKDQVTPDATVLAVLQKEAKKRQESADLYRQGGSEEKALQELSEKSIIEKYLPASLSRTEIAKLVDDAIQALGGDQRATMAAVVTKVRQQTIGAADGALIASVVRQRLAQ